MVNWREDVEFVYGLAMIISFIISYYLLYPMWGIQTATIATVIFGIIMAIAGLAAFESERAVEKWNKLTSKQS